MSVVFCLLCECEFYVYVKVEKRSLLLHTHNVLNGSRAIFFLSLFPSISFSFCLFVISIAIYLFLSWSMWVCVFLLIYHLLHFQMVCIYACWMYHKYCKQIILTHNGRRYTQTQHPTTHTIAYTTNINKINYQFFFLLVINGDFKETWSRWQCLILLSLNHLSFRYLVCITCIFIQFCRWIKWLSFFFSNLSADSLDNYA